MQQIVRTLLIVPGSVMHQRSDKQGNVCGLLISSFGERGKKREDRSDTSVALPVVGSLISDCRKHLRKRERERERERGKGEAEKL